MRSRAFAIVLGMLFAGIAAAAPGDKDKAPAPAPTPAAGSGSAAGSGAPAATPAPAAGSGSTGDDIDMDPTSTPTPTPTTPPPTPDTGSGSDQQGEPAIVKDPKVAKKWLTAAQQLVTKGDAFAKQKKPDDAKAQYENAITAYQKAIEAGDDVTVNYTLALVEDKLGALPEAYHYLKVVVGAQPPVKADALKKAQTKLDEITAKVGLVTLTVEPEGTLINIAGKDYGESPIKEPIVLVPGTYPATFTLMGYQPSTAELKIEAGAGLEKKITLAPIPIKITPHITEEPEPAPVATGPSKVPLIVGASATGVFLLATIITGVSAVSQHNAYTDPTFTNQERADAKSLGKTMSYLNDTALVLTVASAAFTVYWYQYRYKRERDAPAAAPGQRIVPKVDMIPWVQPDAGGFSAVGSF